VDATGVHVFDMAAGTYVTPTTHAFFSSFEGLDLDARSANISYRGTQSDDHLQVDFFGSGPSRLAAELLGGNDDVLLDGAFLDGAGSRIDAGAGQDRLVAARSTGSLDLDLKLERLQINGVPTAVAGVDDAFLIAREVSLAGDAQDNSLVALACTTAITGGHGDDELVFSGDYVFEEYSFSCTTSAEMRGGPGQDSFYGSPGNDRLHGDGDRDTIRGEAGDDRIRGGSGADHVKAGTGHDDVSGGRGADKLIGNDGRDRLIGGPGRDKANGAAGRDRCAAERERRCER
jgi:Ca2+-binding RTX toxin-like protein